MKQKKTFTDKLKMALNDYFKISDKESRIEYGVFTKCPFRRNIQVGSLDCDNCSCFTLRKETSELKGYVFCIGHSIYK